jgi:hypothetical protein
MADGVLSGIVGDEDEKSEVEGSGSLTGAQAFASAVAAKLAGSDPGVARKTVAFLDFKEALGKYDEALKYAPNWKELKEIRAALH